MNNDPAGRQIGGRVENLKQGSRVAEQEQPADSQATEEPWTLRRIEGFELGQPPAVPMVGQFEKNVPQGLKPRIILRGLCTG